MSSTLQTPNELRLRLQDVRSRIEKAAKRSHRDPAAIKLVAVSKTHPAQVVREAIDAGVTDLGENRVQEAETKIGDLGNAARWHLIGHLQSNKARRAVQLFDMIHSLDSAALAQKLDRACAQENRISLPVLIQVDLGNEATKSGATEDELPAIVEAVRSSKHLRLVGLMTLPPFFDDAELVRPFFVRLRGLRDELRAQGIFGNDQGELSMGMTHDFEVAIEEGATIVRVGTAIFGQRPQ
ncbi:MAG TPA: YggS family pyridoxal phosphate-dependent enzyme [Pyrinomonadaceae bacterium]|nr:YggS family pyridoxal phosphate-dependent enzyme [Pyrinomonadaceae bacterium]